MISFLFLLFESIFNVILIHRLLILILGVLLYLAYELVFKTWFFFKKQNVKCVRGLPLFGTFWRSFISKSIVYSHQKLYKQYPNDKFIGIYDVLGRPTYFIRDPDMIKKILVTDFDHFTDRIFHFDEKYDPLLANSVFGMRGNDRWKQMRASLSPVFTASKLRLMHNLVVECSHDLISVIKSNGAKIYRSAELFNMFSSDIVGSCAFGIKVNSAKNTNIVFYKMGKLITTLSGLKSIRFLCAAGFPWLTKYLKVHIVEPEVDTYFREAIKNAMKERLEKDIVRNDLIDFLIKAKQGKLDAEQCEFDYNDMGFAAVQESNIGRNSKKITGKKNISVYY